MSDKKYKKRIVFVGIPDLAYACLDGLVTSGVNIVGVVGPKKDHVMYTNFKDFVSNRGLNFIEYNNLNDEIFIQKIKDLKADMAVVCSFNYKIPKVMLESIKDGFVNLHPSLLPSYRGANPYSNSIINDEKITGVTLHFMNETFDTGDIIAQMQLEMTPKETMGTLFNRTNFMGLELLLKVLTDYEKGSLPRLKQPEGEYPLGNNISEEGLFINYKKTANEIERFIRSLNPFIIASSVFRNTFIKVYSAEAINASINTDYPEGTIVHVEEDKFYVKTGDGILAPTVLQFGSFFVGNAKDFIRIIHPKIGEKFG